MISILKKVGGRVRGQGGLGAKTSGDGRQFCPATYDKRAGPVTDGLGNKKRATPCFHPRLLGNAPPFQ